MTPCDSDSPLKLMRHDEAPTDLLHSLAAAVAGSIVLDAAAVSPYSLHSIAYVRDAAPVCSSYAAELEEPLYSRIEPTSYDDDAVVLPTSS